MPVRLLHISDLHVGTREEPAVEASLRALVDRLRPELVVVTGDLTHRGRAREHEQAARFLLSLGPPVLAVPGNHDIPTLPPARFTRPWREFERRWQTTEPVYRSQSLVVVGVNSVRPWRHQSGGVGRAALRRAAARLAEAPVGALRVVCLHHHLTAAPWRSWKRPVARRGHVLSALIEAGADLILAGHIHQSAVSERREFEVTSTGARTAVLAIAPGLGQPRPRRRGEARGLHVIEADEESILVETRVWQEGHLAAIAARRLPRGGATLA